MSVQTDERVVTTTGRPESRRSTTGAASRWMSLLAFDKVGSGSELRFDAAVGSDPSVGLALYKPISTTRLFVALEIPAAIFVMHMT